MKDLCKANGICPYDRLIDLVVKANEETRHTVFGVPLLKGKRKSHDTATCRMQCLTKHNTIWTMYDEAGTSGLDTVMCAHVLPYHV